MFAKIIVKKPASCQIEDDKCRECQTPCKSAAKTANTIANQHCELKGTDSPWIL